MSWYMQVVTSLGRKIGKAFGEREIALYVVGANCTEINAFDAICCKIYMKTFIPMIRAAIIFGRHGSRSRIPVSAIMDSPVFFHFLLLSVRFALALG